MHAPTGSRAMTRGASAFTVADRQRPAELPRAFPHRLHADARRGCRARRPAPSSAISSSSPSESSNCTVQRRGLRMTLHVVDRLHGDAVRRDLDGGREDRQRSGRLDGDLEGAVGVGDPRGMLAQRTHQAELVEGRRAQLVDQAPDVGDRVLHLGAQIDEQLFGVLGIVGDGAAGSVQTQDGGGQRRAEPVVQVATDPTAFLLAGRDQSLPRVLEVGGQTDGVHRHAGLRPPGRRGGAGRRRSGPARPVRRSPAPRRPRPGRAAVGARASRGRACRGRPRSLLRHRG